MYPVQKAGVKRGRERDKNGDGGNERLHAALL